ncbi:MAG: hypothetical protein ACLQB1_41915 [Streptosporangiaceae bacterium]
MSTGGKCSASAGVSTEVMSSHANGNSSTSVAGTSTRCHGLNGSRRRRRAAGTLPRAATLLRAGAEVAVMSGST